MHLTDTDLEAFDRLVLRLSDDRRTDLTAQIDNLIAEFTAKVREDGTFKLLKFRKAGSFVKATLLKSRGEVGVDADIAAYFNEEILDGPLLHERLRRLVRAVYPQKQDSDFTVGGRTLGVKFHTSGLAVDLVPVAADSDACDYGLQPSSWGGDPVRTSIPGQLEFVRRRKQADRYYRRIVRITKHWRDFQELEALRSFAIECIVAYLQDSEGHAEDVESGLLRLFRWIAQTGLREPVTFPEHGRVKNLPRDPVVVIDPVNADNNVTARITAEERDQIAKAAHTTFETLTYARRVGTKGETLELWKELMGRSFRIEE